MSIEQTLAKLQGVLAAEREQNHVNSIADLQGHKLRRSAIALYWNDIQSELKPIQVAINALPALPPDGEIAWAQSILAMENLVFLEIDTTGLEPQDEIVRFTLINSKGDILEDIFIQPTTSTLSPHVSQINGLQNADLEHALTLHETWDRLRAALHGKYVLSFGQEWDLKQLKNAADRFCLSEIVVVGDDIQRHCTRYYHKEYYLSLAQLCERIGHPLPEAPHQNSLDRARGQYHVLQALANAVTDVRPAKAPTATDTSREAPVGPPIDDGLGDLDEHPF